jgi:hypothetical protein
MREATDPACAVRSIAQMVCRVDMCLVVLIVDTEGDEPG